MFFFQCMHASQHFNLLPDFELRKRGHYPIIPTGIRYNIKCRWQPGHQCESCHWSMKEIDAKVGCVKMATCFLAVPLKRTWEVDLVKPLKTFISDTYSGSDSEDFDQALNEFSKLRNNTIAKSLDKHESALEVLYRYLCYITAEFHYTDFTKFP